MDSSSVAWSYVPAMSPKVVTTVGSGMRSAPGVRFQAGVTAARHVTLNNRHGSFAVSKSRYGSVPNACPNHSGARCSLSTNASSPLSSPTAHLRAAGAIWVSSILTF